MTDKIEELAEQAGFVDSWFSESGDDCETEIKKFAELIMVECLASVYTEVQIIATHKEAKYITEKLKTKYDIQ